MEKKFTYADLCAGIGGFRLGLDKLGLDLMYSCDIDKECEVTYKDNFNKTYDAYDIHSIEVKSFPYVDIICAGFPCQPFSIAGKRNGFSDPRGSIFFKIVDIVKEAKPKVLFLENVTNLVRLENGNTFKTIINELESIDYDVFYEILDSSNFGVPQIRKRVYIVAFRKDLNIWGFNFTKKTSKKVRFKDIIEKGDYSIPITSKWQKYIDLYTGKISLDAIGFDVPKTRKQLERTEPNVDLNDCVFQMRTSGIRALSIDKPLPTFAVSVSGGGAMIPIYSKERRHLSLLEMKRLMGFPDNFSFPVSRTNAIKQLANAVCPPVINSIGKDILNKIK